ncbi:MAG: type II toxin-antitoxin system VapC family toxin [Candidatus Micrarchaeota archaeon]|nr:type II toxin-antitoxin system VapC family toxin [Candidatus Micrarchaeota archaeon]
MKFIDANVFLYAFLSAKATPDGKKLKESAKSILYRVQKGEEVFTTVVHLSEVANIIEDKVPFDQQRHFFESIISNVSLEIKEINKETYSLAIEYAMDNAMGVNDALAVILMQKENINEIYSFDSDFDEVNGVSRITE